MTLFRGDRVGNTELREAFLRSGRPAMRVAADAGLMRRFRGRPRGDGTRPLRTYGDGTRLVRALGIEEYTDGLGYVCRQHTVAYDLAVRLADVLGLDPVDLGI